ncbi:DUF853 family protein [Frankia sp. AgB1.9]|uniref:DUF5663 domain-containing protein n=1 Tax=unclassified Frankia TaxID=2632575 RepID=UPI001932D06A|nr:MULTISPECIES: DUF5663 domain-containing protein [unclassified Frankia]MBL7492790.1 DUF853 family protein [Frankia sp. AgW1.1]MBL7549279.1 DUF853 family protein [Frankia sp. AgB1.9]MBL7619253.1 DUF853 family protein [Frankia sp. AgB1.8]
MSGGAGDTALTDLDLGDEFEQQTDDALASASRDRIRSSELKLKQTLEFCADHTIDIAVFPECSVSTDLVKVLIGYRNRLAIFAGVGQLRDRDATELESQGFVGAEEMVGCNCAVFVSDVALLLVAKRDPAAGENITRGSGPVRTEFRKGRRAYELGLAICMDYVNSRRDFDGADRAPDVVLVSALTRPTEDFLKRPRNFATVFANHSARGGSSVIAPDVAGIFVDYDLGTEPLPPGEAIVAADYAGFASKPTATKTPSNRIHLRAAIVYDESGASDSSGTASGLAGPMKSWSLDQYNSGRYSEFLATAEKRLAEMRHSTILLDSIKVLRKRQKAQLILESEFSLLKTHLILSNVESEDELRYAALSKLYEHWHPLLGSADVDGLGTLIDEVNRIRRTLEPHIRSRYQRITPPTRLGSQTVGETAEFTTFYSARLGRYSVENAVQSLPRQLGVLRTLASVDDLSVRVVYRLSTARQTSGNLIPFFDVLGVTESTDPGVIDDLSEGVGQQLGVAFSPSWEISSTPTHGVLDSPFIVEFRPRTQGVPLVQEDWGELIDYLRALRPQVTVQMTCRRVPEEERVATLVTPAIETGFFTSQDRDAASFLARAGSESVDPASLSIQIHVGSDEKLGSSVLRGIGLWLFKGVPFEIIDAEAARSTLLPGSAVPSTSVVLTPAEALRIFHPPHGRMEGRGLVDRVPQSIPLPAISLPVDGIGLGTARSTQGRSDQRVDVRLDDNARRRHTYIVGRTGSGKTNMLKLMARQDIREGRCVVVIDPHGDLVDYLLGHTAGREDEVLLLDFGDPDYLPVLNPLDLDVKGKADLELAISEFIQLLIRQSYHEFYGPRFEEIVRLTLESITNDRYPIKPPGVIDLVRVLRSKERRTWIRNLLTDSDLKERWAIFEQQPDTAIGEVLHWALSKFSEMQQDGVLGQVLSGGASTISIADCIADSGILLVKLPEWEMSRPAAAFLGSFVQERVRNAVYARWRQDGRRSSTVHMYVDEFQAFAVTGFDELVAEARKFGLALVLAHQNTAQLHAFSRFTGSTSDNLLSAILGNVGNRMVFGVSQRDAKVLSEELDVAPAQLRSPGAFQAVAQILQDGDAHTFTLQPPNADSDTGLPIDRVAVRRLMIEKRIWRSRQELRAEDELREARTKAAVQESNDARRSRNGPVRTPPTSPQDHLPRHSDFLDSWLSRQREGARSKVTDDDEAGDEARRAALQKVARALHSPLANADLAFRDLMKIRSTPSSGSPSIKLANRKDSMLNVGDILIHAGIDDLPSSDRRSLLDYLYETLEVRVGERIVDLLTEEEFDEMEDMMENHTESEAMEWLEASVPSYKGIVREEFLKLQSEVEQNSERIRTAVVRPLISES